MKNHRAKKSLGQNFLKSSAILKKIIEAGEVKDTDAVLEIGPGKGALTEVLLESAGKVLAIEKDSSLVEFLKEKFAKEITEGKLELVEGDVLEFDARFAQLDFFVAQKYKIVANIPYNITGAILKKFLTAESQPTMMVLLVQLEVAKRISTEEKESLLSVSVKAYGKPKNVVKVPARYFSPAPKVDSAVIKISNISREFFIKNNIDEELFWQTLRAGFAHKRKILLSNLKTAIPETNWGDLFDQIKLDKKTRAEDLNLDQWAKLCAKL